MDGERLGPLSYSVHAPEGEASAQRAILLGGGAVLSLMLLGLVGGWFVLGALQNEAVVTNGVPLAILAAGVVVAWSASRESLRRTRRTALLVVTSLALLVAFFSNQVLANIKPALPQVKQMADSIELPPGFRLLSEETFGDRLCRKGCPSVERRYAAPVEDKDPVSTLVLAMFAQGWEPTSDVERRFATSAQKEGLTAQLAENVPHIVELRITRPS